MARKTSFYYSFLVLPADQRRAIIAVWDFCRAVDDAVDETADHVANGPLPAAADVVTARSAVAFWRSELARCYENGSPETSQGRRLEPFIPTFNLPRQAFEDVIDGVAMDLDTTRYETFDDLLQVLPPRGVGRRPHLHQYLRLPASRRPLVCTRPRRRPAADQHPARREGRSRRKAASICRRKISVRRDAASKISPPAS